MARYKIYFSWRKVPFINIFLSVLIIFLIADFLIKNIQADFSSFYAFKINFPWEGTTAIVTALAWISQNKLNKRYLQKENLVEQREELENFKNKTIGQIKISFQQSAKYWFLYSFEEYQYKIDNTQWNYPLYSFTHIKQFSVLSLAKNRHKYDDRKRAYHITKEFISDLEEIKKINLETLGIVSKNYKFFNGGLLVAKGNQNTGFFNKDGRLFSSGQSFETFELKEKKLSHLILKSLHGGNNCLVSLLIVMQNIKSQFEDQKIRREALRVLFEQDSYLEIIEIIKKVFWFKQDLSFVKDSQKPKVKKIIKMMFKKYKSLQDIDNNLKKFETLWCEMCNTGSFFNSHPQYD